MGQPDKSTQTLQSGIINLYKPPDITSHNAVKRVQKILRTKKAGHAGTLDPFAEGVLLVCINRATRIVQYLTELDKSYIVEAVLGIETDSYDMTGRILKKQTSVDVTEQQVRDVLKRFEGEIIQRPPVYSAIKREGVPLYRLARKGIMVEPPPRRVKIKGIRLLNFDLPYVIIEVNCSKGTYVRSLIYDMGRLLKVGATVKALKRTAIGPYRVEDSDSFEDIEARRFRLISLEQALSIFPSLRLDDRQSRLAIHGTGFFIGRELKPGRYSLIDSKGGFLGVATLKENGQLKIEKILIDK